MNTFGDLPWTGFEPGTSGSQSDALPLSQRCSEETDEFSLQYFRSLSLYDKILHIKYGITIDINHTKIVIFS